MRPAAALAGLLLALLATSALAQTKPRRQSRILSKPPPAEVRRVPQTPDWVESILAATRPGVSPSQLPQRWRAIGPDRAPVATWDGPYIGPNNGKASQDSGRVNTILQSATDPNTVYLVEGGGGLWKTTNFFAPQPTWEPKTDSLPTNGGAAAFGCDDRTIYFAIGDAFDSLNLNTVSGLITRSTNGGDTWSEPVLISPNITSIWEVAIIPNTNSSREVVMVGSDVGLFVSTNGARTFTRVVGSNNANAFTNPAPFWSISETANGWLATGRVDAASPTGLWRSADGVTWTPVATVNFNNGGNRVSLYQAQPKDAVVFATVAGNGGAWVDIFRSDDSGATFTALNVLTAARTFDGPPAVAGLVVTDGGVCGGQSDYNQAMVIDPSDPTRNTWYWQGALCSLVTTNNGAFITMSSSWFPGVLPETASIAYMHADGHTGLALVIPETPRLTPLAAPGVGAASVGTASVDGHKKKKCSYGMRGKKKIECPEDYDDYKGGKDREYYPPGDEKPGKYPHEDYPPVPPPVRECVVRPPLLPNTTRYMIAFGNDGGISTTTNTGAKWDDSKNAGIATMLIYGLSSTPLNRDLVTLGFQDNGVSVRINRTTVYGQISTGDGMGQTLSQSGTLANGCLITGINFGLLTDGYTLDSVDKASKSAKFSDIVRIPIAGYPNNQNPNPTFGVPEPGADPTGQIVYGTVNAGLLRSTDCGRSWTAVPNPPAIMEEEEPIPSGLSPFLHGIAVARGSSTVLALTRFDDVFLYDINTPANGKTARLDQNSGWVGTRPQFSGVTSPAWSSDNSRLFVASAAPVGETSPRRVAVADATQTPLRFTLCVAAGLIDSPISQMVINPANNHIYVGTWAGVFRSTDGCATFSAFNNGFPNTQVKALALLPAGGGAGALLRAGTYGRSAFEVEV